MKTPPFAAPDSQRMEARLEDPSVRPALESAFGALAACADRVAQVWTQKYLESAQSRSFLTASRIRRVLGPLSRRYLDCLAHLDLTRFSKELERSARDFFETATPFEEVLLCAHLFREACAAVWVEIPGADAAAFSDLRPALDELARLGSSVMAAAYYRDVQRQWECRSEAARQESDVMRRQIESLEQDLFSLSSKKFAEIDRSVSTLNRRIHDSSAHYREVYELARRLEYARDIPSAVGIFFKSVTKALSPDCETHCGLLDERKTKIRVYSPRRERVSVGAELTAECRLSVLSAEHRESLFDPPFRKVLQREGAESVEAIFAPSRLDRASEYAFFPVSFHDEPLGFVWVASASGRHLTQDRVKLIDRFSRILSGSIFGLQNFLRNQKHAKLVAAIEQDLTPERTAQWEGSLDRYLNVFLDLTGVERASLMILDPKEKRLRTFAAKGYRVYPFSGRSFAMGEGMAGTSLKDLKTICVSRMRSDDHSPMSVKSLACIPLWSRSTPIGVLNLSTLTFHKTFEASEIEMAQKIARRLSDTLSGFSLPDSHSASTS